MSDQPRRSRPESVLKRLPPDRQAQIVEYANQPGVTLVQTAAWLRKDGLNTNKDSLSRFLCWYTSRKSCEQSASAVEGILETLKEQNPEWTEDQLTSAGNCLFSQLAIQRQDNLEWVRLQREKSRTEAIGLERDKIEVLTCEKFLVWFKDQRAREIAESNISTPDKIKALRQTYFADVEELEKSGEVELPK
jgi:hypothetical protein